jgi:hypothetical protein
MDQIRIVKDNDDIYLSKDDLVQAMKERLDRFPDEYEQLKNAQESKIVDLAGNTIQKQPNEKEIAKHEGMEKMLRGIIGMIDVNYSEGEKK